MNELQKKLDELIAIKNSIEGHPTETKLDIALTISDSSVYGIKLRKIAKKYKRVSYANITNFNTQVDELQRLSIENTINYTRKTEEITTASTNSLNIILDKINIDIKTLTIELARVTALKEIRTLCNTTEYVEQFIKTYLLAGIYAITDNNLLTIRRKIKSHCDWHYPGLQLCPTSTDWIDCMVGTDPLYITCHRTVNKFNDAVLIPFTGIEDIINTYPPEYQRRIRIYNIENQDFSALPERQFGCIACCEFLNLFDIDIIKQYINRFCDLLRPGGILICNLQFTSNPNLTTNLLVDPDYFKYAAGLILQNIFNEAGYVINSLINISDESNNWVYTVLIEAHKPGILTTTKAHQVLGSIIEK